MKRLYTITIMMLALSLSVSSMSCTSDDPISEMERPVNPDNTGDESESPDDNNENEDNNNNPMSNDLKITVGTTTFSATLENNAAAAAFKALLPMTVNMSDMNGNEKYHYLSGSLPTSSSSPGTIQAGDLMLYGSSCVVLFYETFRTSYSYTRLGRISNPSGLVAALGSGSVNVTFE